MSNVFTITGTAWTFYQRQPVLNAILLWLIILPLAGTNLIIRLLQSSSGMILWDIKPEYIVAWLGLAILQLLLLWGTSSVLIVGKRLLSHSAGRSRSSFRAVRNQALSFVVPLLLTSILRACLTFLWTLLFILPGIVYHIRTVFYAIVTVCDRVPYRAALIKSKDLVRGHTWHVLLSLIGLSLITFLPAYLLTLAASVMITITDDRFTPITDIIDGTLNGIALLLFTLSLIILYQDLQKKPRLVPPPPIEKEYSLSC